MKKALLLLTLIMLYCIPANAIYFEDEEPITQGYRGFVDFSYTLGVGRYNINRISLMTSHGYQIVPQFYAGAGVGANYYYDRELWGLPVFAHLRSDILNNEITPYVDLRVGYSLIDVKGVYINPSVGCRIELSDNNIGLNVGVGYTMQQAESFYGNKNCGGIDFRVGIDF